MITPIDGEDLPIGCLSVCAIDKNGPEPRFPMTESRDDRVWFGGSLAATRP